MNPLRLHWSRVKVLVRAVRAGSRRHRVVPFGIHSATRGGSPHPPSPRLLVAIAPGGYTLTAMRRIVLPLTVAALIGLAGCGAQTASAIDQRACGILKSKIAQWSSQSQATGDYANAVRTDYGNLAGVLALTVEDDELRSSLEQAAPEGQQVASGRAEYEGAYADGLDAVVQRCSELGV